MYQATAGGEGALARKRRDDMLRAGRGKVPSVEAADRASAGQIPPTIILDFGEESS